MLMTDIDSVVLAAIAALQARDWPAARAKFELVVEAGRQDADVWAMLAQARKEMGDGDDAHAACNRVLSIHDGHPLANLVKADLLRDVGEVREANVFYGKFLAIAAHAPRVAQEFADGVKRARAFQAGLKRNLVDELELALERSGYSSATSSRRFTHALDLLTGRKRIYAQRPVAFLFPELPTIQFYARDQFPWAAATESQVNAINAELDSLLETSEQFHPYYQSTTHTPIHLPLADSMNWNICSLWKAGELTSNADRCPKTMAALNHAPLCHTKGRSPMILFSRLAGGARIQPHTGYVNTRLICHLPLIVPPRCSFRVGNEVRSWRRGELIIFDDTIEHEAWNGSNQDRVVLIFDIWRPELSEEERALVTALLETLDTYGGGAAIES